MTVKGTWSARARNFMRRWLRATFLSPAPAVAVVAIITPQGRRVDADRRRF
jgi:hypothetical protein